MDMNYFKVNIKNNRFVSMCPCATVKFRTLNKNFITNSRQYVGVLFNSIELLCGLKSDIRFQESTCFQDKVIDKDFEKDQIYVITFSGNVKYIGTILNDQFDGLGKLFLNNKLYYEGEFKNNLFHGYGELFSNFFDIYSGEFSEGCVNGLGKVIWHNGTKYSGNFKDNLIDGIGTYSFSDGSFYHGSHLDGKRSGLGIYTSIANDGTKTEFVSDFWNELPFRKGIIKCDSNSFYYNGDIRIFISSEFRNYILPHGIGKLKNKSDVDTYVGEFKFGLKDGVGKQYNESGDKLYSGHFFRDKYEGFGKLYDSNGFNIYDGNFHLGEKHGEGWISDRDSKELVTFKLGKRFGKCVRTSSDLKISCNYYCEEKIVSQKYKNIKESDNSLKSNCETCSICFNNFCDNNLITKFPKCGHIFHSECIFTWLKDNESCPICRDTNLFKENIDRKRKFSNH